MTTQTTFNKSAIAYLKQYTHHKPDAIFYKETDTVYTYSVLYKTIISQANQLLNQPDIRSVGIACKAGIHSFILLWAAVLSGKHCFIMSHYLSPEREAELCEQHTISVVLKTLTPSQNSCDTSNIDSAISASTNSTIHLFSSGSTGKAKCIVHRLQHFLINASVANKALSINSESRYLLNLPCFHVSGLSILFRSFLAGACVIKDSDINRAIVTEKVTHMSCVERQLRELLTVGDNKHLEAILLGGGPVHDSVLSQAIEKGFPLYLTYGMTETCSQIAIAHHAKLTPGFTGRLQPHAKAKLSDTKELLIQCDSLFLGYLTETKKGLHKPLTEGYFATGDLAEISDSGEIKILGRLDNMFISNGENIYPEAIESVIKSVSGVTDAVVVSVADRDRSQVPVAFIKADVDIESLSESINAVIKTKLSSLHVPKYRLNYPELKGLKANRKALTSLAIQYQSSL